MGREPRVSAVIITAVQRITAKNNEERLTGNRLWGIKTGGFLVLIVRSKFYKPCLTKLEKDRGRHLMSPSAFHTGTSTHMNTSLCLHHTYTAVYIYQ